MNWDASGDEPQRSWAALGPPRHPVMEIGLVLGVSLGRSAIYSVLQFLNLVTQPKRLGDQTTVLNGDIVPDRPWLDLLYQLAGVVFPIVPALLALYLLSLTFRHPCQHIGFTARRPVFDLVWGVLILVGIGVPGILIYLANRALGTTTEVQAGNLTMTWYAVGIYLLSAAMNGIVEEVIMIGYLFTRLGQVTSTWPRVRAMIFIVALSATMRGTYHLYQGPGQFVANVLMGVVFGLLYLKIKRVMPLVVGHTLLDIAAYLGSALLAGHVSWL